MSFFSIIIPTYNRAHCIMQTVESVQKQIFQDWEILVIDDGSMDGTAKLFENITDTRINYYYKENGERGAARNFGAKHARGEYFFFLDSDDLIKPNYLKHAFEIIEKTNSKCIHIPYNYKEGNSEKPGPEIGRNIAHDELIQNRFACQIIVHRSCMEEFSFSENREFKIGEDWYFILLLLSRYTFEIGTERLGLIVQHDRRSMADAPYQDVLRSLAIFESEFQKKLPDSVETLKYVRHELTNLAALHAAIQKERAVAWRNLMASIRIQPFRIFRYRNFVILKKIIVGS